MTIFIAICALFFLRRVRRVASVSHCKHLRRVTAPGARRVRRVNTEVIEIIAPGEGHSAPLRAAYTTYIPRHRLLARRAWVLWIVGCGRTADNLRA